jgi:hypothetical protein
MSANSEPTDLALDFVELNKYLFTGGGAATALARLVVHAVKTVPGCAWAAITSWHTGEKPRSIASTGPVAASADELQYRLGEGPSLDAASSREVVWVPNLARDDRWPRFSAAALTETPARGVLSFHLLDEPARCALNLYSSDPDALTAESVTVAALFAAHARVLLLHADSSGKAAGLTTALNTSRQIGAAIGILMNAHHVTQEEAFDLLRQSSSRLNRKLRDVADDVMLTGELPPEEH